MFVSVQKSLALEIKRNEMLSSELSACHESVSSLKDLSDELNAKLEKANATSSCVEHVVICNRCKDVNFDEHAVTIAKLNNEVASLNAQLKTCKDDFDKLKFARDAYTIGRHPSIKHGLGFQKETKNLTSQRPPISKGKGRLLWRVAHMIKRNMPIYTLMLRKVLIIIIVMIVLLIMVHMLCLLLVLLLFMVEVGLGEIMLLLILQGKFAMDLLLFIMLAILLLYFHVRMQKL
jgi:predicted RNase H-like nuclease (RuvC/YqgF family)